MTLRRVGVAILVVGVLVAALAAIGGRLGLFAGSRPTDLGAPQGRLREGDWRPNWVSSQVARSDAKHYIAPLAFRGTPPEAWERLASHIRILPRTTIVTVRPDYLHAEFATAAMGFVDDVEFLLDPAAGVIHVRSGARLGIRDFNVNRDRVEALRAALAR